RMRVLVACEFSGVVRRAFAEYGHYVVSADFEPSDDGSPNHYIGDCFDLIQSEKFDLMIAHPPCTYFTSAAAWALKDPDYVRYPGVGYHQRVQEGTLTGAARRLAQANA